MGCCGPAWAFARPKSLSRSARFAISFLWSLGAVPTVAELGFPGFSAIQWWGLSAPAHTTAAIVDKLNAALNDALAQADVQRRLADTAAEPSPMGSEYFAAF